MDRGYEKGFTSLKALISNNKKRFSHNWHCFCSLRTSWSERSLQPRAVLWKTSGPLFGPPRLQQREGVIQGEAPAWIRKGEIREGSLPKRERRQVPCFLGASDITLPYRQGLSEYVMFCSICLFLIQAYSPWLKKGTVTLWLVSVRVSQRQVVPLAKQNIYCFSPLCADHRWARPYGQDTGNESGISESGSEAAVTTETSILEDLATIDLHMSASSLSAMATARHHTVCLVSFCSNIPKALNLCFKAFEADRIERLHVLFLIL